MIISPPFLPDSDTSIAQVPDLDAVMTGGEHGYGAFPVSLNGWWHGGMHIVAPGNAPVRAIADGKVHYLRKPTPKPERPDKDDPLYYNGGWTDNGCVVIKHTTEIGEDTELVWYSVYMHLREIGAPVAIGQPASTPTQGQSIWRKQVVGKAGAVYGRSSRIHFEIVMDEANLKALIGRNPDSLLDAGSPGRTDAVWGECYVALPSGTKVYQQDMRAAQKAARRQGYNTQFDKHEAVDDHASAHYAQLQQADSGTLGQTLIVGINYHEGQCTLTSYSEDGKTIGTPRHEGGTFEYDLFDTACELYPDGAEAGYQLLRFGRVLNGATHPGDMAHWRKIALPDGSEGWVNLSAKGAMASSDADFPPWRGWLFAHDDTDGNVRCNSVTIKKRVLADGQKQLPANQFVSRLKLDTVRDKLQHAICKMPSDWDISRREQIWHEWRHDQELEIGYLPPSSKAVEDKAYQRLSAHVEALCFWSKAGLPEPAWHLPPKAFIAQMRRCGWLSKDEMLQMFPMTAMRKSGGHWVSEHVPVLPGNVDRYHVDLNKACRIFGIVSPSRMAAFYGNAMQETQWFGRLAEGVNPRYIPRYYPWIGRGFLQLTWPSNYIKYWRFTGKQIDATLVRDLKDAQKQADRERTNAPLKALEMRVVAAGMDDWRQSVSTVGGEGCAAETAGAYWAWSDAARDADQVDGSTYATKQVGNARLAYYKNTPFGEVAATVNVGHPSTHFASVNGITARFQAYTACQMVLFDVTAFPNQQGDVHLTPVDYQSRQR